MTSSGANDLHVYKVPWEGRRKRPQEVRLRAALLNATRRLTTLEVQYAALQAKLESAEAANDTAARTADETRLLEVTATAITACSRCFESAANEARRGAWYAAWDCMHQFEDEILAAMSQDELAARWCSLCAEAKDKLKGTWRGEAADCLMKRVSPDKPVPREIVRELQTQLATAAQNQQHKLALFENRTVPLLAGLLGLFVGGVLVVSIATLNGTGIPTFQPWAEVFVPGILAGALGGMLSTAFSLGRFDPKKKIPEVRLSMPVTSMRAVVGAAVAIPVAVLVESGYVSIASLEKPFSTLAFCFVAGFSERWFLGLIERFDAEKK